MQLKKRYTPVLGGVVALAATAGLVGMTIQPAAADPTRPYSATGSDTTQDVWNGLTNAAGAPIPSVASWNAFASGDSTNYIQTKSGGNWFERPAGSTNGARALSAVWDPAWTSREWWTGTNPHIVLDHEDVDFARSSSGPNAGTGLKYIPFARDALTIAFNPAPGLTTLNITPGQITELFTGVDNGADSVVQFSAQPATLTTTVTINGVTVQPKIPQQGSGTRAFFQQAAGAATLAPYIADPAGAAGIPENSGTGIPNDGDLIGFSAANWISQVNGKVTNTTAGLAMATINGAAPFTGTPPNLVPGPLFGGTNLSGDYNVVPGTGVGVYNRDTYNVVPTAFIGSAVPKQSALVGVLSSASGVYGANSKTIIKAFGFGFLAYGSNSTNWRDGIWRH